MVLPDKMSQYHWLKIKSIFQIYCTAGTWKPLALGSVEFLAWCEFLCCAVGDPGCDGWEGTRWLEADSAAMGLLVPSSTILKFPV